MPLSINSTTHLVAIAIAGGIVSVTGVSLSVVPVPACVAVTGLLAVNSGGRENRKSTITAAYIAFTHIADCGAISHSIYVERHGRVERCCGILAGYTTAYKSKRKVQILRRIV